MIGADSGLIHKIRQNLSHIIGGHCVTHRLNLSILSSAKNGEHVYGLDPVLKKVYKFYQYSAKRMK
jgi:hypothetical protein